jgi:hypothetical protein
LNRQPKTDNRKPNTAWLRDPDNPIIHPQPGSWKNDRCTSSTVTFKDGTCYFYHDGGIGSWWNGVPGFNWIGLLTCPEDQFDGKTFSPFECNPILTHGRYCDIDRIGMISPRVALIDGQFFLYYCTVTYDRFVPGTQPRWIKNIGLAISEDGINFEKCPDAVLDIGPEVSAGVPNVIDHDGRWHMLYSYGRSDRSQGVSIHLTESDDPRHFHGASERVFGPEDPEAWDGNSIVTPAICLDPESGWYYMLYGGCSRHWDYPASYGLARSRDLRNWERHPANPVIERGGPDDWDGGAMWITEFIKIGSRYYAWYEGRSAGRDRSEEYSPGAVKQIGLMTLDGDPWESA